MLPSGAAHEGVQFVVGKSKVKQSSSRHAGETCLGAQAIWVTSIKCSSPLIQLRDSGVFSRVVRDWTYPTMHAIGMLSIQSLMQGSDIGHAGLTH